jgi:hypothetical protein
VDQRHGLLNLNARQTAQPFDSLFAQQGASCVSHLANRGPKRGRSQRLARKFLQRLGPEKHFIRVTDHALPAEIANAVDNLDGARTGVREITAVENQVGRGLLEIGQDCLECGSVSVDVGEDCDAHHGILTLEGRPTDETSNASHPSNTERWCRANWAAR